MGDRCYWTAQVKRQDLDAFVKIVYLEENEEEDHATNEEPEEWVELVDEEANWLDEQGTWTRGDRRCDY